MRNRPITILLLLLCATGVAAQVPSITTNSKLRFVEGNTIFDRTVGDIFSTIDVSLTTGVTGTLPVANGGTGVTSIPANRLILGNGTGAFLSSTNLTFTGGNTLNVTGKQTLGITGSVSTSQNYYSVTGTVTSTANSLSHNVFNFAPTFSNDGTVTGNTYAGMRFVQTTAGSTNAISYNTVMQNINSSPNVSQLYGMYARVDENSTTGSLGSRYAGRFDLIKSSTADAHTGTALTAIIQENSTGRWSTARGLEIGSTNGISNYGIALTATNNRGTGNTQYGIALTNAVSGSGVVVDNAYGLRFIPSETSSGEITTYHALYSNTSPTATTNYWANFTAAGWQGFVNGSLSLGVDAPTSGRLVVRGAGATSGTNTTLLENSSGDDILTVRDDGVSAFGGSPATGVRLTAAATTADSTSFAFDAKRSSTSVLKVRGDGKVTINNAAFQDALTVNGKVRADGLVLTNQTSSNVSSGQIQYNNGSGGTHSGYLTIGDGTRQLAIMPTMIERHIIDYAVDWTTGRKGAFWTVPARFAGWKIAKAYIEVTSVGSGAGDDVVAIEIGGVTEGEQYVTAGSHTLVMDDVLAQDDVITFNVTAISATPAKGLHISLELSKN